MSRCWVEVGAVWHYKASHGSEDEVTFVVVDNRSPNVRVLDAVESDATVLILHTNIKNFRVPVGRITWWPSNYLVPGKGSKYADQTMRRIA